MEVLLTVAVGSLFGRFYGEYVDRIGLKGDEWVLDFGSGSGNPARHIARRLKKEGRLTCVDISRTWTKVARRRLRRYPNVEFRVGDIAALDLPDAGYDIVFVHFVLHDIIGAERPRIVEQLGRKLNPEGRLFLREPLRFIAHEEIRQLMRHGGLVEVSSSTTNLMTQGRVYEGVFALHGD